MKIKNQVCSLELAKKLKELGVKKEGYFAYYYNPYHGGVSAKTLLWEYKKERYQYKSFACFAFTVAELGEILPKKVNWKMLYYKDVWNLDFGDYRVGEKTEADARAKMLIYLIENSLIKL